MGSDRWFAEYERQLAEMEDRTGRDPFDHPTDMERAADDATRAVADRMADDERECPCCDGAGDLDVDDGDPTSGAWVTCPVCKGEGYVEDTDAALKRMIALREEADPHKRYDFVKDFAWGAAAVAWVCAVVYGIGLSPFGRWLYVLEHGAEPYGAASVFLYGVCGVGVLFLSLAVAVLCGVGIRELGMQVRTLWHDGDDS